MISKKWNIALKTPRVKIIDMEILEWRYYITIAKLQQYIYTLMLENLSLILTADPCAQSSLF